MDMNFVDLREVSIYLSTQNIDKERSHTMY